MKPRRKLAPAVMVYVILLLSLQIFLLSVTMEGFLGHDPGLSWTATIISMVPAGFVLVFYRFVTR